MLNAVLIHILLALLVSDPPAREPPYMMPVSCIHVMPAWMPEHQAFGIWPCVFTIAHHILAYLSSFLRSFVPACIPETSLPHFPGHKPVKLENTKMREKD